MQRMIDATIRRCIKYAKDWGYGGLYFGNLFSFRTRDTKVLQENFNDAVRPDTDRKLEEMIFICDKVVCAWGNWEFNVAREAEVLAMIKEPMCLQVNKNGTPKHPLYCKGVVLGIIWTITKDDFYLVIGSLFIGVMGLWCARILFKEAKKIKNEINPAQGNIDFWEQYDANKKS